MHTNTAHTHSVHTLTSENKGNVFLEEEEKGEKQVKKPQKHKDKHRMY